MAIRERTTLKQSRFARAYVAEGNGTEAVVRAGYKVKSRAVARAMAPVLLANDNVKREVETWQARLERNIVPSLQVVEEIRDTADDNRVRLAASRDLLNRAGVGKHVEGKTNVVAVFANMDETKLLEKMAQLAAGNAAKVSDKQDEVSHNTPCTTLQENGDAGPGTGVRLPESEEKSSPS